MRRLTRKTIVLLVAVIMTLSVSVGMTIAYFSDTASAEGGAVLLLQGQTEIHETPEEGQKTISIENISTDPVDMVTRVRVYAPVDIEPNLGSGWADGGDGWWYYTEALAPTAPGNTTTNLVVTWEVKESDHLENYDVVVVHESSVATYNDAGEILQPKDWKCPTFVEE